MLVEDDPDALGGPTTDEAAHAQPIQTTAAAGEPAGKRPAPTALVAEENMAEENKRLRLTLDKVADEWLCPITQELPLNPVMAEDARIYERSAIGDWFRRNEGVVLSPVTCAPMGRSLKAVAQVRNTMECMIESEAITGDRAESWKKHLALKKAMQIMRRRAAAGEVAAMYHLGVSYLHGAHGLPRDAAQAFSWLKQAADLGHVMATVAVGTMYCYGQGTKSSVSRGVARLGRAVELGSDLACYRLGFLYQKGIHGCEKVAKEASFYYAKIPNCTLKALSAAEVAKAAGRWCVGVLVFSAMGARAADGQPCLVLKRQHGCRLLPPPYTYAGQPGLVLN
jgi:hypothetical protein